MNSYIVESRSLLVRLASDTDLPDLIDWFRESDHMRFVAGSPLLSTEKLASFLRSSVDSSRLSGAREIVFICEEKSTGHGIGYFLLSKIDWIHRAAELQLAVGHNEMRNRTKGIEIALCAAKVAFDTLKLRNLYASVLEGNLAMIRILSTSGASSCGVLRQHAFSDGRLSDIHVFCLTPRLHIACDKFSRAMTFMKLHSQPFHVVQ